MPHASLTQHFAALDPCPACDAYRYLAARRLKHTYEIFLIHHQPGHPPVRKYRKVASIGLGYSPFHGAGNFAPREGDSTLESLRQMRDQLTTLITDLAARDKTSKA